MNKRAFKNGINNEINFISTLRIISFLKNNIMSDLLKKYKFKVDHEENVIQVFDLKSFESNKLLKKNEFKTMLFSPVYEIEVRQTPRSKKKSFTLVDLNHSYDSSTGFYNEKHFKTVTTILRAFEQMIEEELNNFLEYSAEVDYHRAERKGND